MNIRSVGIVVGSAVLLSAAQAHADNRVRGHNAGHVNAMLAAGATHALLLTNAGGNSPAVLGWGSNASGELLEAANPQKKPLLEATASGGPGFTQLTAGNDFSLGLMTDGTIWGWGNNSQGQLGDGSTTSTSTPTEITVVEGEWSWMSVVAGRTHAVGILSGGQLLTWGSNTYGELGIGTTGSPATSPQFADYGNWVSASAGNEFTVGIKADGTLWTWGLNSSGQLGLGSTTNEPTPHKVGSSTWTQVAAGGSHVLAIRSDGSLWAWGNNAKGQVGNNSTTNVKSPVELSAGPWLAVAAGDQHSVAIRYDGTLWTWGYNSSGQLDLGNTSDVHVPTQASHPSSTTQWEYVAAGLNYTMGMTSAGSLYTWGDNGSGQLGNNSTTNKDTAVQPTWTNDNNVSEGHFSNTNLTDVKESVVAEGAYHTLLITQNGELWDWGSNSFDQLGVGGSPPPSDETLPVRIGSSTAWIQVVGGVTQTLGIQGDGSLWAWGYNEYGEVGDNTTNVHPTPVQICLTSGCPSSDHQWAKVYAGNGTSFGIRSDGTLWAWGYNGNGQLGNGSTGNLKKPTQISVSGESWVAIAPGYQHTLGLTSDGKLWAWGDNSNGELGDGTHNAELKPKHIGTVNTWIALAAGYNFSAAINGDGTVYAWGLNANDQLGDGTTTEEDSPEQILVSDAAGGTQICSTWYSTVVQLSDGSVDGWGLNSNGELAVGSTTAQPYPAYTSYGTGPLAGGQTLACGGYTTMTLSNISTMYGAGYNGEGEIGDGFTDDADSPDVCEAYVF